MNEIIHYNTIQYNFIDLRRRNSLLVRLRDRDYHGLDVGPIEALAAFCFTIWGF